LVQILLYELDRSAGIEMSYHAVEEDCVQVIIDVISEMISFAFAWLLVERKILVVDF